MVQEEQHAAQCIPPLNGGQHLAFDCIVNASPTRLENAFFFMDLKAQERPMSSTLYVIICMDREKLCSVLHHLELLLCFLLVKELHIHPSKFQSRFMKAYSALWERIMTLSFLTTSSVEKIHWNHLSTTFILESICFHTKVTNTTLSRPSSAVRMMM